MSVIEVSNVSKAYRVYFDKPVSLKERIIYRGRYRFQEKSVLENISFSIDMGECVGLIGSNGSGKSTLLKLLTKIIYPDNGNITVEGKTSSLLELGAGFHPEMTGIDNIYNNASIFGMSNKEITKIVPEIIDFSELGEDIYRPVRTYSSGMYMRLAFSIAINIDARVLLIDEILAVGDAKFQGKCMSKLRELKSSGITIVIVSHDLSSIEQLCERVIWIDEGKLIMIGDPYNVHPAYLEALYESRSSAQVQEGIINKEVPIKESDECTNESNLVSEEGNRYGNKLVKFKNIGIFFKGKKTEIVKAGSELKLRFDYEASETTLADTVFGIAVKRTDGLLCYGTNTNISHVKDIQLKENGSIICTVERMDLLPGKYSIDVAVHDLAGEPYDYWIDAATFEVYSDEHAEGVSKLYIDWDIN